MKTCLLIGSRTRGWSSGLAAALALALPVLAAEPVVVTVQTATPGAPPTQFGVFYEDINFAGDGGLYAELVKNRSFEFEDRLTGWKPVAREGAAGEIAVRDEKPLNPANPHYLRVSVTHPGKGYGVVNEGFRGMGVRTGERLDFSVHARQGAGERLVLELELQGAAGQSLGSARVSGFTKDWTLLACSIRATGTDPKARLNVIVHGTGWLDMDMVSLFPHDTYGRRPNGLRADLVQLLKDLKPGFMRFPGGCIVEGTELAPKPGIARPYQWKDTIGPVAARKGNLNRWNYCFKDRPAPDYYQSYGLGFYEFFQLCDDIGAAPLPILNCGMACQFESKQVVPLDQLDPYIQDALDLIEFANGPAASVWGGKRAEMGHLKPFGLRMIGVGNEQWGPGYFERYERFAKAIHARYPDVRLVTSSGPSPDGKDFEFAWTQARALKADIVDEHYYQVPAWFLNNSRRYDAYDPAGPKVFAGEYAAQSVATVSPLNRNSWECALAEAAFMTGLERNSAVVTMSSYAPLFGHTEAWQWRPNLMWFDSLRSFGTPNYYVQKLFANHRGDAELPVKLSAPDLQGRPAVYACASLDTVSSEVIVKLVNPRPAACPVRVQLAGVARVGKTLHVTVLGSADLKAENTLDKPATVAPRETRLMAGAPEFAYEVPAQSMVVIRAGVPKR